MGKPFQVALALWVTPDFSEAMAGGYEPPRVDHADVNFLSLADLFAELFPCGPSVAIQVPNDTIDLVSVFMRDRPGARASIRCEDFGMNLLECAKTQTGRIIDVRTSWQNLHYLPDRNFAPPPVILPFIVTNNAGEVTLTLEGQSAPAFGLPLSDPFCLIRTKDASFDSSKLPPIAQQRLANIFGIPFEAVASLDRMTPAMPQTT